MFATGCMSLMVAGMVACYSGDVQGNVKLTCSDATIQGLPTCKEQMAKTLPGSANGAIVTLTGPKR